MLILNGCSDNSYLGNLGQRRTPAQAETPEEGKHTDLPSFYPTAFNGPPPGEKGPYIPFFDSLDSSTRPNSDEERETYDEGYDKEGEACDVGEKTYTIDYRRDAPCDYEGASCGSQAETPSPISPQRRKDKKLVSQLQLDLLAIIEELKPEEIEAVRKETAKSQTLGSLEKFTERLKNRAVSKQYLKIFTEGAETALTTGMDISANKTEKLSHRVAIINKINKIKALREAAEGLLK